MYYRGILKKRPTRIQGLTPSDSLVVMVMGDDDGGRDGDGGDETEIGHGRFDRYGGDGGETLTSRIPGVLESPRATVGHIQNSAFYHGRGRFEDNNNAICWESPRMLWVWLRHRRPLIFHDQLRSNF